MKKNYAVIILLIIFQFLIISETSPAIQNDIEGNSPTWTNWPNTLVVIFVEFPDMTHEAYLDTSDNSWTTFDIPYTTKDFFNMLASDDEYTGQSPGGMIKCWWMHKIILFF